MSHDTIRPRWILRCLIRYNYRHTADTNLAYSTQRREEIERAKRQGERGRGQDKKFPITKHEPTTESVHGGCETYRQTQTQTDTDRQTYIEIQSAGEG